MSELERRVSAIEKSPQAQGAQRVAALIGGTLPAEEIKYLSDADLEILIDELTRQIEATPYTDADRENDRRVLREHGVTENDIEAFLRRDWGAISITGLEIIGGEDLKCQSTN